MNDRAAALPTVQQIEAVARDVLRELATLGGAEAAPPNPPRQSPPPRNERDQRPARQLVSEADVRAARARGEKVLVLPEGAIVTPLAHDVALDSGLELRFQAPGKPAPAAAGDEGATPAPSAAGGAIALGSDHGGFKLKEALKAHLARRKLKALDLGTTSDAACDYPDFAARVARAVALGEASVGIVVDGAGIGSCMAANKVPGVLAATCHDERTAKNSREHNAANVLCLGSGTLDEAAAVRVVDAWLDTGFGGGRHARRVAKVRAIERSFVRR